MRDTPPEDEPVVYALRIVARARRQILDAFAWITETAGDEGLSEDDADERAREWLRGLEEELSSLSRFPRRCPIAEAESRFSGLTLRRLLYRRTRGSAGHHVFYSVDEDGDDGPQVWILRVRPANLPPMKRAEALEIRKEEL